MRQRRSGSFDLKQPSEITEQSAGYLLKYAPDHPLSHGHARVYEHRYVYHRHYGDGPFECYWCSCRVSWGDMHIDHLNDDKQDNDLLNLVASCALCNQARGRHKIVQTYRGKSGVTLRGETLTFNEWAERVQMSRSSILSRIRKGWSVEDAVFTPRGPSGPKRVRKD